MAASTITGLDPATLSTFASAGLPAPGHPHMQEAGIRVVRRNGSFSPFDAKKISTAITKAFVAVEGTGAAASRRIHEAVAALTSQIVESLSRRADSSPHPYRRHPGSGRVGLDAQRRA